MSDVRTVLITGASSGLGAEMARQMAAAGLDLALAARRVTRLEELKAEILAAHPGRRVEVAALDVNDHEAVFSVTADLAERLGGLDRVVVNAGLGKGAPLGTGRFDANLETAMTNFVGALAQTEAAMAHFRERGRGHLVMVSSMSAKRGLPKATTTYAATKVAVAHLVEGLRTEFHAQPAFRFTVLYPGYIISEMNDYAEPPNKLMSRTADGVRSMVAAIDAEVDDACVPRWPWSVLSPVMTHAPTGIFKKLI